MEIPLKRLKRATSTSQLPSETVFKEHLIFIHVLMAFATVTSLVVDQHPIATPDNEPIEEAN